MGMSGPGAKVLPVFPKNYGKVVINDKAHDLPSHKCTHIQTHFTALLQLASWPQRHLELADVSTYLHSEEVIHRGDDDIDSCIVASLSSQVILKIYIKPIFFFN